MFAVQNGGHCQTDAMSSTAQTFDKYGKSTVCKDDGEGGPFGNQVYVIKGDYSSVMNDFPVIVDLVMRTGLWDRQGANIASRYKEMYGVELFLRLKPVSLDRECRILP